MEETRFYFHDFRVDNISDDELISAFKQTKTETENSSASPFYVETDSSKLHIQIIRIEEVDNTNYFFGNTIATSTLE